MASGVLSSGTVDRGPGVRRPVIPRPDSARPGAPGPWEVRAGARRRDLTLSHVLASLDAGGRLGPVPPLPPPGASIDRAGSLPSPSAVLVALFEEAGETRVLLTRRADGLRSHRGEVCFPGGRVDPGEDAPATALREAFEEVALSPAAVDVAGWLRPVQTLSSRSHISPVVGRLDRRPSVVPSAAEVDRVFDVALADLLAEGAFREERWAGPSPDGVASSEGWRPVWFFEAAGETIWGATARVLYELLSLASSGPSPG